MKQEMLIDRANAIVLYGEPIASALEALNDVGCAFVDACRLRFDHAHYVLEAPNSGLSFSRGSVRGKFVAVRDGCVHSLIVEIERAFDPTPTFPADAVASRITETMPVIRKGEIPPEYAYGDFPWR